MIVDIKYFTSADRGWAGNGVIYDKDKHFVGLIII